MSSRLEAAEATKPSGSPCTALDRLQKTERVLVLQARGFDLDDNSVNLDEIKSIGPGGNFFMAEQTMQLFRDTHFKDSIWPFLSLDEWQSGKHPNADAVLRQHTRELMENATPPDDHDELIERGEEFIRKISD